MQRNQKSKLMTTILTSRWTMLVCAFAIMFINSFVNNSVKSTTNNLTEYLNIDEKQLQTFTVSSAYILSIPLSLYGSLIIHKVGTSKSLILWTAVATIGWMIFTVGISIKNLVVINIGRFLQGGAFGAMRVAFNAFCVKWFGKKHIALSMGFLRMAHNISHVVGSIIVIDVLTGSLGWSVEDLYWRETWCLVMSCILAACIWWSARIVYKHQKQEIVIKKKKKLVVFKTEGQVEVTKKRERTPSSIIQSNSLSSADNSSNSLKSESHGIITKTESDIYLPSLKIVIDHSLKLFKNPIFVLMIVVGFCYDGTVVCFTAFLKKLLKQKFLRSDTVGREMGLTKYCGFAAPVAGYIIDKVRKRQYFMLCAGICLVTSTLALFYCKNTDIFTMYMGLLGISFGQLCYGNSFWPAISSIAGKEYQVVGYGFMGAVTSLGAVILPLITGAVVDNYQNIAYACLVFGVICIVGLIGSILIIIINYLLTEDYVNRKIKPKHHRNTAKSNQNLSIHIENTQETTQ